MINSSMKLAGYAPSSSYLVETALGHFGLETHWLEGGGDDPVLDNIGLVDLVHFFRSANDCFKNSLFE